LLQNVIKFFKIIKRDEKIMSCNCCHICGDCGKPVRNKFIFGTLHFCISTDEKKELEHLRWQMREQMKLNKNKGGE
jgi:hypothetical protein